MMSDRTTVLFFHTASDSFGGGSQMLFRLLKSIDKDSYEPVVLAQFRDELCRRVATHDIRVEIIPFQGILDTYNQELLSSSPSQMLRTGFRILQFNVAVRHLLKRADIVWCKNLRAVLTLTPYASISNTPLIWNIGLGLESQGKLTYLNEVGLRLADTVFMEYEEQASQVFTDRQREVYADQFTFFHKGINVDKFTPSKSPDLEGTPIVVGTAAVLSERKGIEHLIDAVANMHEREVDIELQIAGEPYSAEDETYKQHLENKVKEKGIDDIVTFIGWVEDMPTFLDDLDVFVLPSFGEGIPGAVREALAMERPVVATDVGGTSEVVQDGETGLLVEPGNAQSITQALRTLIENPRYAMELGVTGRKRIVQEYSMERYVERYEQLLESLVK